MKKSLILIAVVILITIVYFSCFNKENKETTAATANNEKPVRLSISKNSPVFNEAFTNLLSTYYGVKDALVNWDSTKAGNEAQKLSQLASVLPVDSLKADESIIKTAHDFTDAIRTKGEEMQSANSIQEMRRSFSVLTDKLYSLINTVRYDREVIYYDMCPMAFNGEEQAYWLSRDSAISNPYLGNKHPKYHSSMSNCGDVEDVIDYAAKK